MVLKAFTTLPMSVKLMAESNGALLSRSMARVFLGAPSGGLPSTKEMPLNASTTLPMSVKLTSPNGVQTSPHKAVRISREVERKERAWQACIPICEHRRPYRMPAFPQGGKRLPTFCGQQDCDVVERFKNDGESGNNLDCPKYKQERCLILGGNSDRVEQVVAWSLSRFGRVDPDGHIVEKRDLRLAGVAIASSTEAICSDLGRIG